MKEKSFIMTGTTARSQDCINNNDIKCFPVGRSLSTGVAEEEDEDNGDEEEED